MFSLMVILFILFSTKCSLFVYTYIDLLKLKAYKLFENSDADLYWLLFERSQLVATAFISLLLPSIVTMMYIIESIQSSLLEKKT